MACILYLFVYCVSPAAAEKTSQIQNETQNPLKLFFLEIHFIQI